MALDPLIEAEILDWIGAARTGDEDLAVAYARCGSVEATALSVLNRRRALLGPDSWSVAGDYAQNDNGRTARWLDTTIANLEGLLGLVPSGLPIVTGARIRRGGPNR